MTICFDCLRNATRERFDDVEYVEVDYSKVNGRTTKYWFIYCKNNTTHKLKYRDYAFYWANDYHAD